ncbi:hypothetical protein CWI37_0552p0010 [Hamiltosporidium tvaerminnensis]|uniref:Uncharacterized protein n=1 Tax=Hamiltosporidium tvaerminnensis TaxID=1176355 RepID=A0A4Q9L3Q1_9MICR|nr:hypothetical protein CWI37_0552p0010 [Hamiltosporidium tvaerminnensis]
MFLIIFESNDTLKEYCTDNSTNKNIFLFKDKNHYLSNICGEEPLLEICNFLDYVNPLPSENLNKFLQNLSLRYIHYTVEVDRFIENKKYESTDPQYHLLYLSKTLYENKITEIVDGKNVEKNISNKSFTSTGNIIVLSNNFKNLRIISLYNVEIPFDSFKDISIEDFKKPNLLSIGYFMKSVNSEEIVRAYSIFGSNILKTYLMIS